MYRDEAAIVAFSVYEHEDLEGRLLERDASFTRAALPNNTVVMDWSLPFHMLGTYTSTSLL